MNACSFFGHRDFLADEETTKKLKETITDLIIKAGEHKLGDTY